MALLQKFKKPWVVAHRGANTQAPENSTSAFDIALSYPVYGIELDVQLTRDGVVVIYHDRNLKKINATQDRISDLTLSELNRLDWGSWYAKAFAGQILLTLEQTLTNYLTRTILFIEIKSRPVDQQNGISQRLTEKTLDWLDQFENGHEHCRILSFDANVLAYVHHHKPQYECVLNLADEDSSPTSPENIYTWPKTDLSQLTGLCVDIDKLTPNLSAFAHNNNLSMLTYSCNQKKQVNHAMQCDVDIMMTDDPGWLTKHLADHIFSK